MATATTADAHYLTCPQAADRLDVTRVTVWRWVRDERLPSVRVGRDYLIPTDEVERLSTERDN